MEHVENLSPLASPLDDPILTDPRVIRYRRVFGDKRLSSYLLHLKRMSLGLQWFVFVAPNDAKCFTRWVKLAVPVRNPRSITGSQKFIAAAKNDGVIF